MKHGDRIQREGGPRPFSELIETGLLWYLNRVAFHPRGFAIGLCVDEGEIVGWELHGDGTEPWSFTEEVDDVKFAAAEATLDAAKAPMSDEGEEFDLFGRKVKPFWEKYVKEMNRATTTPLVLHVHSSRLDNADFDEALRSALGITKKPEPDQRPVIEQLEENMRTVFAPKQLPDYAAYRKLTDPPSAFPESVAGALEELCRKVWAAGYPVGEITIGTTTDYETNEMTFFAEADVIPWKEES